MPELDIIVKKGERGDAICAQRVDGSEVRFIFPKKGPFPHDLVHAIVESALGFERGFWGCVADGAAPEDIQEMAKAGGHASASRAQTPDASIVQLIQSERIVECFEADLWGAPADAETFRATVSAACSASLVPNVKMDDRTIESIRARIETAAQVWFDAPVGAQFELRFLNGCNLAMARKA